MSVCRVRARSDSAKQNLSFWARRRRILPPDQAIPSSPPSFPLRVARRTAMNSSRDGAIRRSRMSSFDAAAWCLLVFSWSRKWLTCNEAMVRNSADTCPAALQAAQLTEKLKRAHALCADIPGSLGQSSVQRALAEKNLSLRTKFLSRGPLESEGRLNKPQRCGLSKELETFEHREFCVPRNPRIVVHSTVRSAVVCGDNLWKPETLWTNGVCGKKLKFFSADQADRASVRVMWETGWT